MINKQEQGVTFWLNVFHRYFLSQSGRRFSGRRWRFQLYSWVVREDALQLDTIAGLVLEIRIPFALAQQPRCPTEPDAVLKSYPGEHEVCKGSYDGPDL